MFEQETNGGAMTRSDVWGLLGLILLGACDVHYEEEMGPSDYSHPYSPPYQPQPYPPPPVRDAGVE